jgi:precorrin-2 dehydrogenase/sirohydrochlorin ferrochelatase
MPTYYPLHLNLTGQLCLVVGGGHLGERRSMGLIDAGARVRVVCLEATPGLIALRDAGKLELLLTPYAPEQLTGARLVFVATNDADINRRIGVDAAAKNVWINRADAYESGDFIVPAVVRRGELCVSVSTGGNQPLLTARLIAEFEARFGDDYGLYVEMLGRMRALIKTRTDDPAQRRQIMLRLLDAEPELRLHLQTGDVEAAINEAVNLVNRMPAGEADHAITDDVH